MEAIDFVDLGLAESRKENWDSAIAQFTEALKREKTGETAAIAYFGRSNCWRLKGDDHAALRDLNDAILYGPEKACNFDARGEIFRGRGQLEEAMNDFDRAIAVVTNIEDAASDGVLQSAFYNRSITRFQLGKYDAALCDINEAIRLDPKDSDALHTRALIHTRLHHWRAAFDDLYFAIELKKYPIYVASLASLYATCTVAEYRDGEEAVRLAEIALQATNWEDYSVLISAAEAHAEVGDFPSAVHRAKQSLARCPKGFEAFYQRRLDCFKRGEPYRLNDKDDRVVRPSK